MEKGRKTDEIRIEPREGCEGQDEVKKDTGGKLVKGIYTLPLSSLKDRQGGRLTSTEPISRLGGINVARPDCAIKKGKDGESEGEILR